MDNTQHNGHQLHKTISLDIEFDSAFVPHLKCIAVGKIVPGILFGLFQDNDFLLFLIFLLLKPNPAPQQTSVIESRTVGPGDRPNRSFVVVICKFNTWVADKNAVC